LRSNNPANWSAPPSKTIFFNPLIIQLLASAMTA
jgi:hypothetical protein